MEHNHRGLVQIIFLSKWLISRFQPLIFQGVTPVDSMLVYLFAGMKPYLIPTQSIMFMNTPRSMGGFAGNDQVVALQFSMTKNTSKLQNKFIWFMAYPPGN